MDMFQLFLTIKIAEASIVPNVSSGDEFRAAMNTFTGKQGREAKRKFRKLWRKFSAGTLSTPNKRPSRAMKKRRRALVFRELAKLARAETARTK
jgi:hypothetical protein